MKKKQTYISKSSRNSKQVKYKDIHPPQLKYWKAKRKYWKQQEKRTHHIQRVRLVTDFSLETREAGGRGRGMMILSAERWKRKKKKKKTLSSKNLISSKTIFKKKKKGEIKTYKMRYKNWEYSSLLEILKEDFQAESKSL